MIPNRLPPQLQERIKKFPPGALQFEIQVGILKRFAHLWVRFANSGKYVMSAAIR